jgi:hypothetical protein
LGGARPGVRGERHASVWPQGQTLLSWFKRLIQFSYASSKIITFCYCLMDTLRTKKKLSADRHCTWQWGDSFVFSATLHSPLVVAFTKPLSPCCNSAAETWLRAHSGRVGSVLTRQWTARCGLYPSRYNDSRFRKSGIWPLERNVFTGHGFAPAETTNVAAGSRDKAADASGCSCDHA